MNTLLFHVVLADVKDTGAPLQLRDVAAALRKQDDVNGVLKALQQAGPLVAAAPDELSAYAGAAHSNGFQGFARKVVQRFLSTRVQRPTCKMSGQRCCRCSRSCGPCKMQVAAASRQLDMARRLNVHLQPLNLMAPNMPR